MGLKCIITNTEDALMKNLALLVFRVFVSGLLLSHGISKIMNFSDLSAVYFDPLSLGSSLSLSLVIFAEVVCSIMIIAGFFARLASLPIIFMMSIAVLVIHAGDPFSVIELPLLYLGLYIVLFFVGPGKYACDSIMSKCFHLD